MDSKQLVDIYLNQHKELYPLTDQTSNLHSANHWVDTFENLGPFKEYSGFIFESINGQVKNQITSATSIMEQVCARSEVDFMLSIKEEQRRILDDEWMVQGKPHSYGYIYKSMKKKDLVIRQYESYVMLECGRFFF